MAMVLLDGVDAFPTVPNSYLDYGSTTTAKLPYKVPSTSKASAATSTGTNYSATPASASATATATGAAVAHKPLAAMLGGAIAVAALI
jgi:hypothetical protein